MNLKTALLGVIGSIIITASAHAETPVFSFGATPGVLDHASDWRLVSFSTLSAAGPAVFSYELVSEQTSHAATQTFSVNGKTIFGGSSTVGAFATSGGATGLSGFAFDSHAGSLQKVSTAHGNTPFVDHSGEFAIFESKSHPTTFALTYEDDFRPFNGLGDFNDMVVRLNVAAVPEPGTYAMMGAGLAALALLGRRRTRAD